MLKLNTWYNGAPDTSVQFKISRESFDDSLHVTIMETDIGYVIRLIYDQVKKYGLSKCLEAYLEGTHYQELDRYKSEYSKERSMIRLLLNEISGKYQLSEASYQYKGYDVEEWI